MTECTRRVLQTFQDYSIYAHLPSSMTLRPLRGSVHRTVTFPEANAPDEVPCHAMHPWLPLLAVSRRQSRRVYLVDVGTGVRVCTLPPAADPIVRMIWHPTRATELTILTNHCLLCVDMDSMERSELVRLESRATDLVWSSSGQSIAWIGHDPTRANILVRSAIGDGSTPASTTASASASQTYALGLPSLRPTDVVAADTVSRLSFARVFAHASDPLFAFVRCGGFVRCEEGALLKESQPQQTSVVACHAETGSMVWEAAPWTGSEAMAAAVTATQIVWIDMAHVFHIVDWRSGTHLQHFDSVVPPLFGSTAVVFPRAMTGTSDALFVMATHCNENTGYQCRALACRVDMTASPSSSSSPSPSSSSESEPSTEFPAAIPIWSRRIGCCEMVTFNGTNVWEEGEESRSRYVVCADGPAVAGVGVADAGANAAQCVIWRVHSCT